MIFINTFKIFLARFGLVFGILLYLVTVSVVLAGISLPIFLVLNNSINNMGVMDSINEVFKSITTFGGSNSFYYSFVSFWNSIVRLVDTRVDTFFSSTLFLMIIIVIIFRLFATMYEVPLASVLDKYMSANASIGFLGSFFVEIKSSFKFTLHKIIFSLVFDLVIVSISALLIYCLRNLSLTNYLPFIIMSFIVIFLALKSSVVSCWIMEMISNNKTSTQAFRDSVKVVSTNSCIKTFVIYLIAWVLMLSFNILVAAFSITLGLIITVPISILLFSIINTLIYYNINSKRYYIVGVINDNRLKLDCKADEQKTEQIAFFEIIDTPQTDNINFDIDVNATNNCNDVQDVFEDNVNQIVMDIDNKCNINK